MSNEEKQFKRHLEEYWQSKGIQNVKIPQIGGRDLDFYLLYKSVTKRGGAQQVSMSKLWKEVVNEFGLPPSCTSASFTLRNHYSRYLLAYEQKFFFGKNDSQAIKELQGSRIRKQVKINDDDQDQMITEGMINQGITNTITEYGLDNQNQPQLKQVINDRYAKRNQNEEIYYVKKTKTVPYQSEIKRIVLAFESRIVTEITYSLNCLLVYSCNNLQPFILDQYPALLEEIVNYWDYLLKPQNSQFKFNKEKNYQIVGEIVELEQSRIISQVIRNLSLIKINQKSMTKNKNLIKIIQKNIIKNQDLEIRKCSFEIFAQLSRHFTLDDLIDFDKLFEQLIQNINPIKNSEIIESALISIKYLMMNQENISQIENQLLKKLQEIAYLLLHKNIDIRELTLEILCFLSDQKMSTRLAIMKQPKMIQRLIGTMSQFGCKTSERFVKLASQIMQNIVQHQMNFYYLMSVNFLLQMLRVIKIVLNFVNSSMMIDYKYLINFINYLMSQFSRQWLKLNGSKQNSLRVMTYNLLAESYVIPKFYQKHKQCHLDWKNRQQLIIYSPNINLILFVYKNFNQQIFKQKDVSKDLVQSMKNQDYQFIQKLKRGRLDGCGLFFKQQKFQLLNDYSINLALNNELKIKETECLDGDQVAMFIVLQEKESQNKLLICNTHLIWSPKKNLIKFYQLLIIQKIIIEIKKKYKGIDLFLCGDFNLIPNSYLYTYLTNNHFPVKNLQKQDFLSNQIFAMKLSIQQAMDHFKQITRTSTDIKYQSPINPNILQEIQSIQKLKFILSNDQVVIDIDESQNDIQIINQKIYFNKELKLTSSYAEIYKKSQINQNPEFNNFRRTYEFSISHITQESNSQVDYIFYQSDRYKANQILQCLPYEDIIKLKLFPNEYYPSDHLCQITDFITD